MRYIVVLSGLLLNILAGFPQQPNTAQDSIATKEQSLFIFLMIIKKIRNHFLSYIYLMPR